MRPDEDHPPSPGDDDGEATRCRRGARAGRAGDHRPSVLAIRSVLPVLILALAGGRLAAAQAQPPGLDPSGHARLTIDAEETTLAAIVAFLRRDLRHPVVLDLAGDPADLPPITLSLEGVRMPVLLEFVSLLCQLQVYREADGTWTLSDRRRPPDQAAHQARSGPFHPVIRDQRARLVIPPDDLLAAGHAIEGDALQPAVAAALGESSRRVGIAVDRPLDDDGWRDHDHRIAALLDRTPPAPFHPLRRIVALDYRQVELAVVLDDLSRRCAIPIRLGGGPEGEAPWGMLPRITLQARRITLEAALTALAEAAHLHLAEAGDGALVLYDDAGDRRHLARHRAELAEFEQALAVARAAAERNPTRRATTLAALLEVELTRLRRSPPEEVATFRTLRSDVHLHLVPSPLATLGSVDLTAATPEEARRQLQAAYGVELRLKTHQPLAALPPITLLLEDYELGDALTILGLYRGFTLHPATEDATTITPDDD